MQIQFRSTQNLRYLVAKPEQPTGPPLVLVHGAYNDAWIWSKTFLPWFAEQGRDTYALFLKDPETVARWSTLFRYRLRDYVHCLKQMVELLDEPPILVGHSMGGLTVQRYLSEHRHAVRAACLLASLPPFGLKHTLWEMGKHPYRLLQFTLLTLYPTVAEHAPAPRGLLSKQSDQASRRFLQQHLVRESARALFGTLTPGIDLDAIRGLRMHIMGAGLDTLALPRDVQQTAQLYGQEAIMRPEMGHFMMLEPGWEELATQILELN